jgi:hypothetical protein
MKLRPMCTVTQQFTNVLRDAQRIVDVFNAFVGREVATIAGGCVRDYITGIKQPKDIDVIIEYTDYSDYAEIIILAKRLGYHVHDCSATGYEDNQIKRVFTLTCMPIPFSNTGKVENGHKLPIDVIFVSCTVEERIENFTCNISQVCIREGKVYGTDVAKDGLKNRCVVINPNAPTFNETYEDRMREYFPDWKHIRKVM